MFFITCICVGLKFATEFIVYSSNTLWIWVKLFCYSYVITLHSQIIFISSIKKAVISSYQYEYSQIVFWYGNSQIYRFDIESRLTSGNISVYPSIRNAFPCVGHSGYYPYIYESTDTSKVNICMSVFTLLDFFQVVTINNTNFRAKGHFTEIN